MPSHNFDLNDPKNTLRVLLALTVKAGGELRLKATTFDSIQEGRLLFIDYDGKKNEIVLRASSGFGRAVAVHPESYSWVKPINEAPTERARVQATQHLERRFVPSDEEQADLEEKISRSSKLAQDLEENKNPLRIRLKDGPKPA